jgi:hypothetical protein
MNSRELDRSPSTLNFGRAAVSRTLAERATPPPPRTRPRVFRHPRPQRARARPSRVAGDAPSPELPGTRGGPGSDRASQCAATVAGQRSRARSQDGAARHRGRLALSGRERRSQPLYDLRAVRDDAASGREHRPVRAHDRQQHGGQQPGRARVIRLRRSSPTLSFGDARRERHARGTATRRTWPIPPSGPRARFSSPPRSRNTSPRRLALDGQRASLPGREETHRGLTSAP